MPTRGRSVPTAPASPAEVQPERNAAAAEILRAERPAPRAATLTTTSAPSITARTASAGVTGSSTTPMLSPPPPHDASHHEAERHADGEPDQADRGRLPDEGRPELAALEAEGAEDRQLLATHPHRRDERMDDRQPASTARKAASAAERAHLVQVVHGRRQPRGNTSVPVRVTELLVRNRGVDSVGPHDEDVGVELVRRRDGSKSSCPSSTPRSGTARSSMTGKTAVPTTVARSEAPAPSISTSSPSPTPALSSVDVPSDDLRPTARRVSRRAA